MRTIKFRAWDSDINKMFLPENIGRIHFYPEAKGITTITKHGDGISMNFKLMQFTGLSDKFGKEIYEGDIVYVPEGYGGDLLYKEFIGIVDYDPPEFYINQQESIKKTRKWYGQEYGWDELEIIGNIYENPELIK